MPATSSVGAAVRGIRASYITRAGCAYYSRHASTQQVSGISLRSSKRFLAALSGATSSKWIGASSFICGSSRFKLSDNLYCRQVHASSVNYAAEPLGVPEMGESISEGTIIGFMKEAGEEVDEDDIIAQIETDKITVDVRAPKKGVVTDILVKEGDVVKVGEPIAKIDYSKDAKPSVASNQSADKSEISKDKKSWSPSNESSEAQERGEAAKMEASARKNGADQNDNVDRASESSATSSDRNKSKTQEQPVKPKKSPVKIEATLNRSETGERRVAMTRMRKRIAERLKEAQNTAAMLTTFNEMDMSALMDLRREYKDAFEKKHGAKLGFMSAFVKACTVALIEQPEVNAFIDGSDIVYRDYVDISVAVSTPKGLVVPAIRGCENLNFATIEKTIVSLGDRARKGEITIEEMQGGTFTISNGGVFGSLLSTPIINMPQSAILGMHIIQKRPVVVNDQITIRPMMYVALSYDHRLIDGREAVTFLRRVKTLIEDPRRLLLEIDI